MELVKIDTHNRVVSLVHAVHLRRELPSHSSYQVEVGFISTRRRSKFGTGELSQRVEIEATAAE